MAIKNLEKMDIYNPTNYVNNSEPDIDADNLNKTENKLEETVAKANEIIDALKTLISTVQANSDNTVPSSSLAYAMKQEITKNKEDIATANSNLGDKLLIRNTMLWSGKNYADDYRAESIIFYCNPVQGNLTTYNYPVNETGVFRSVVCNQFITQTYVTINNALYQRIAADSSSPFSAWELK